MAGSKVIGVDLGGTNLRAGIVKNGKVLKYLKEPTPKIRKELLDVLVNLISKLMGKEIKGIGVGAPGPLKDGVVKNTPNLPLKNFDLQGFLEKKFKKKVVVGNDADVVALAEAKYGCKGKNFFILTLGTGVGGGVIINGELYRGNGSGGELGHIIIHNDKDLEYYWKKQRLDCKRCFGKPLLLRDLLKKKDKKAYKILDESAYYMGQGIASLINIFDPEIVILMGGARETGNGFLDKIRKEAKEHVLLPNMPKIVWSKLKHPGILGASLIVK